MLNLEKRRGALLLNSNVVLALTNQPECVNRAVATHHFTQKAMVFLKKILYRAGLSLVGIVSISADAGVFGK